MSYGVKIISDEFKLIKAKTDSAYLDLAYPFIFKGEYKVDNLDMIHNLYRRLLFHPSVVINKSTAAYYDYFNYNGHALLTFSVGGESIESISLTSYLNSKPSEGRYIIALTMALRKPAISVLPKTWQEFYEFFDYIINIAYKLER